MNGISLTNGNNNSEEIHKREERNVEDTCVKKMSNEEGHKNGENRTARDEQRSRVAP